MQFGRSVKEGLVFVNRTANRTAELITHQTILDSGMVGEPIVGRQSLNPVVFKDRTMPLVGPAFQHRVGNKTSALAVLGGETVGDDTVLLNCIGGDACGSATFVIER